MKLSHLREAPPRHGGNVCMRGKTSHPSYLQFTPDRGNPGNSPVVHACKTHKSTMSTNCPPGHALACMESNRAKTLHLASSAKAQKIKCFFSACNEHNAHGRLKRSASTCIGPRRRRKCLDSVCHCVRVGLSVSNKRSWFVCEQQENALKNATRCTFVSSGSFNRGRSATLQMHFE